jgi:hypothetical protein
VARGHTSGLFPKTMISHHPVVVAKRQEPSKTEKDSRWALCASLFCTFFLRSASSILVQSSSVADLMYGRQTASIMADQLWNLLINRGQGLQARMCYCALRLAWQDQLKF